MEAIKNPFEKMIENVTMRQHKHIEKYLKPLSEYFYVKNFAYIFISHDGYLTAFMNNPTWAEVYWRENLYLFQPHFRHPTLLPKGISLPKSVQNDPYKQNIISSMSKFDLYPGIFYIQQVDKGIEILAFDAATSEPLVEAFMINEINLMKRVVENFRQNNIAIFEQLYEDRVNYAELIGRRFYDPAIALSLNLRDKELILKKLGVPFPDCSKREKEVLKSLLQGASAGMIAGDLSLSPRTVEGYIVNLKNKFNCCSKQELTALGLNLQSFGML